MHPDLAALLICPECKGGFAFDAVATCGSCARSYPVADGIVSMTRADAYTALDEIDYDAVYRLSSDASHAFVRSCLSMLGDRMPSTIDTFLEIGAGTGQFTLGFLKQVPTRTAVVTDISSSMLGACRRRLVENGVPSAGVHFVTWDGADCLRRDAFQLIAGFSVLHHVLDFQTMLATLAGAMRQNGIAVFLEPNYRFHLALIDTVCEIFVATQDDPCWSAEDRLALSDWLFENNTNLRFRGDAEVLAGREDKHLFDGDQLAHAASAAGFGSVELVPFGGRSECYVALEVYSNQIGLRDEARADLLDRFSRLLPGNFGHLADEDLAPSTLIVLRRDGNGNRRRSANQVPIRGGAAPRFAYDIVITTGHDSEGEWTLTAQGWVLGDTDVRYLAISLDGAAYRFPVQAIRPDVNNAFNARRVHPLRRSLFCGVAGATPRRLTWTGGRAAGLLAVAADGREFLLAQVELPQQPGIVTTTRVEAT
ncbi:methyltransferase [Cognatilysobacter lacus]|uniref:Methyltransferase n=1 Tax=Cognatilysobacter lacus TaxID=1643323 RepID=A0A5D8Z9B7_9GAMM|nr:methyltransferase [Lysobacter lacus]TZF91230.1 methyltransferase [Lysobacter lacus]